MAKNLEEWSGEILFNLGWVLEKLDEALEKGVESIDLGEVRDIVSETYGYIETPYVDFPLGMEEVEDYCNSRDNTDLPPIEKVEGVPLWLKELGREA